MSKSRNLLSHSPDRVRFFHKLFANSKIPPAPSGTRWGVWIKCVDYYNDENLQNLIVFCEHYKTSLMTKSELSDYNQGKMEWLTNTDNNEDNDDIIDLDFECEVENENVQLEQVETQPPPQKKRKTSNSRHSKIRYLAKLQSSYTDPIIKMQIKYIQGNFPFIPRYF